MVCLCVCVCVCVVQWLEEVHRQDEQQVQKQRSQPEEIKIRKPLVIRFGENKGYVYESHRKRAWTVRARSQRAFTSIKESGLYTLYTVVRQWRIFRRKVIQSDLKFWWTARVKVRDGKTGGRRLQWSRRWQNRKSCWIEGLHVRLSQGDPEPTGSRGHKTGTAWIYIYFFAREVLRRVTIPGTSELGFTWA